MSEWMQLISTATGGLIVLVSTITVALLNHILQVRKAKKESRKLQIERAFRLSIQSKDEVVKMGLLTTEWILFKKTPTIAPINVSPALAPIKELEMVLRLHFSDSNQMIDNTNDLLDAIHKTGANMNSHLSTSFAGQPMHVKQPALNEIDDSVKGVVSIVEEIQKGLISMFNR